MCKSLARLIALGLAALALILSPYALRAATRNCTSGLVTQGVCRVNTNVVISYDAPPATATTLATAVAFQNGCETVTPATNPATCSTLCTQALVSASVCSAAQRDARATITLTVSSFADAMIRWMLVSIVRQYNEDQAIAPVRTTARAAADPDIGN